MLKSYPLSKSKYKNKLVYLQIMSEKMTTDDLVFVLLAKLPSGAVHQVHVSQDKIQENLLLLIDGDSLQLYQDPIDTLSIIKNSKDDKKQNTLSGEDAS